jgi:hypothetical protein
MSSIWSAGSAAIYVDMILKSAKPSDLPFQQSIEFRPTDQSQGREVTRPHFARVRCLLAPAR